jgi:hypothetical protein
MGFWDKLKKGLLPENDTVATRAGEVTNNQILNELLYCFDTSCENLSVGETLLFNMNFMIILSPETYDARMQSFAPIVNEAVKGFYKRISNLKGNYAEVTPVSTVWRFKFGPASSFNNEVIGTNDIRVIGMPTGYRQNYAESVHGDAQKVTMRVKLTNAFDKMDLNPMVFRNINFLESGTFEVRYSNELKIGGSTVTQPAITESGIARIDYYIANKAQGGKYTMKDTEIVIARKEAENLVHPNYLLIDSEAVSNPHARIRYVENTRKFQIASFSNNETRVNEATISKSELGNPTWTDLPDNSQILLNTMVTLKFKNIQHS